MIVIDLFFFAGFARRMASAASPRGVRSSAGGPGLSHRSRRHTTRLGGKLPSHTSLFSLSPPRDPLRIESSSRFMEKQALKVLSSYSTTQKLIESHLIWNWNIVGWNFIQDAVEHKAVSNHTRHRTRRNEKGCRVTIDIGPQRAKVVTVHRANILLWFLVFTGILKKVYFWGPIISRAGGFILIIDNQWTQL